MLSRPRQTQQQEQPTASLSSKSVVTAPAISLPKRGGAIRGIGEQFAATGPSRLGPQLNLTCDSGSGNGPFGFGWSLSLLSLFSTRTRGRRATVCLARTAALDWIGDKIRLA